MGSTHPENGGPVDIQLAVSCDGVRWLRLDRRSLILPGETRGWMGGSLYMSYGMIVSGARSGCTTQPFTRDRFKGVISRTVLRLDGFTSIDAGYEGGELVMPPIVSEGSRLVLNVETSTGGHVRVGFLEPSGDPIRGCSVSGCDPVNGNSLAVKAHAYAAEGRRLASYEELWEYKSELAGRPGAWVHDLWSATLSMYVNFYKGWADAASIRAACQVDLLLKDFYGW